MAGDTNNSQMESFNGNAVRHREKVIRSLKRDDSAILAGLRLYHNHVRPHLTAGRPNPRRGGRHQNRWIQQAEGMIQAAAKSVR